MTDGPRHGSGLVGLDQQRLHAGAGHFVPHGAEMGESCGDTVRSFVHDVFAAVLGSSLRVFVDFCSNEQIEGPSERHRSRPESPCDNSEYSVTKKSGRVAFFPAANIPRLIFEPGRLASPAGPALTRWESVVGVTTGGGGESIYF